jgi:CHAT domain-containing protein/Tfp pilus assembly protein PilF
MRTLNWFGTILAPAVLLLFVSAQMCGMQIAGSQRLQPGVVIEKSTRHFQGDKAGIQAGDIVLGWSSGKNKGEIDSPFDLAQVEIEQGPRGSVTLLGRRGQEVTSWTVDLGSWGLASRPNYPASAQMVFSKNQRLETATDIARTSTIWMKSAVAAENHEQTWLSAWILLHAANLLADKKAWPLVDKFFNEAVLKAGGTAPAIRAQILEEWCQSFVLRSDWSSAVMHCQEALEEIHNREPEGLTTARYHAYLGRVFVFQEDLVHAEEQLKQALDIQQKSVPESIAIADTLMWMGVLATQKGSLAEAGEFIRKALGIQQKLVPGGLAVAQSLSRLAILQVDTGDLAKAEQLYNESIAIQRDLAPGSIELAATLSGLGIAATNQGRLVEASRFYRESLAIYEKNDPKSQKTGVVLSLIAQLDWTKGDRLKSEQEFRRAEKILKRTGPETHYYAYCLLGLGILRYLDGDLTNAEAYLREMLAIQLKHAPTHLFTADAFSHLGLVLADRGDLIQAEEYYLRALNIERAQAPLGTRTAQTLDDLRDLAERRGDLLKADDYATQALAIRQQAAPGNGITALALAGLASIKRQRQQPELALTLFEQSLNDLEIQMDKFGGSSESRSLYRADQSNIYFQYIDLLVQQQQVERAVEILERWRARSLLETIANAHVDITSGAEPELVAQERIVRSALNTKSERRIRLLAGAHTPEELQSLDKEITELTAKYQEAEERLRESSPVFTSLMHPRPLSVREIQNNVLDENTLLLEYILGKERSYVFAVTRDSVKAFEVPGREKVEKSARAFYRRLTMSDKNSDAGARTAQQEQAQRQSANIASELSRMVLGPVAERLGHKRIVIVADGALQFTPFTALPDPAEHYHGTPLVVNHEVVDLPSATVLAVLRLQRSERVPQPRSVAVFADPVFDKLDNRVGLRAVPGVSAGRADETSIPESARRLSRSAGDIGLIKNNRGVLPRLLFSRKEAAAILGVSPGGKAWLDFNANRETATRSELSEYRIIHFATHGLVDSQHPELSGLVLSMVDKHGNPQDGFLQLQDIYNLKLPANLVVLSACETALGKEINGEGMVGLTRGFMYAGASRVVASLWKVSDVATATLMADFYRAMEKDGMPASAALRAAQINMWKQKRWSDPYFWAAFQIQGEWR